MEYRTLTTYIVYNILTEFFYKAYFSVLKVNIGITYSSYILLFIINTGDSLI